MAHWSQLTNLGIDLHVAGTLKPPQQDWWDTGPPEGVKSHIFEPRGWVRRNGLWWFYPGLKTLIREIEPDIIHVAAEPWALFYSQVLDADARLVGHGADNVWTHGSRLESRLRLARARHVLGRLDGFVSWNEAGIRHARAFGLGDSKPTLLAPSRLPIPEAFRQAAAERTEHRKRLGIDGRINVGFVGRLVPEKGLAWLIDAVAKSVDDVQLVVVGSGPDRGILQARADAAGVQTRFLGGVKPDAIAGIMASFDLLVIPSIARPEGTEQFGRVAIEAMFAGTPVISSDSGALPEVVGEGGITVHEGDIDGLARAIARLTDSERQRLELGRKGLDWATRRFSPLTLATAIATFWQQILEVP